MTPTTARSRRSPREQRKRTRGPHSPCLGWRRTRPASARRGRARVDSGVGRYYDSTTGQFLTIDPLIDKTDQAYAYVVDDPINITDPNGQSIPQDWSPGYNAFTSRGASFGAHAGPPSGWAEGQPNGYPCLQTAWDENLGGTRFAIIDAGFGNLSGPQGLSYWGPLVASAAAFPAVVGASAPEAIGAGLDAAFSAAEPIIAGARVVSQAAQDVVAGDPEARAAAIEQLWQRLGVAFGSLQSVPSQTFTSVRSLVERVAVKWLTTFFRGY